MEKILSVIYYFMTKKRIYLKSTQICDIPILDKLLNFIFHTIIKRKIFF